MNVHRREYNALGFFVHNGGRIHATESKRD